LQQELEFAESYVYLQQIRFGDNLKVNFNMDNKNGKVVPLAIQMLIENAIKHNEVSSDHPLKIDIAISDVSIVVSNNLQPKSLPNEGGSGVGLENIRKRYAFLTSQPVEFTRQDGKFEVKIPKLTLS